MLTSQTLAALERALHGEQVLTVYVAGAARDPAERHVWQRRLESRLRDEAQRVAREAPHEHDRFAACLTTLYDELAAGNDPAGAPGWVMMITRRGVQHTARLPVDTGTVVTWQQGPDTVPYLHVLRRDLPVLLVMTDQRHAEIARIRHGALEPLDTITTDVDIDITPHMGDAPRQGFHAGTRGTARTDVAQRAWRDATEHLLRDVAARITRLDESGEWVVLGGNTQLLQRLRSMLPPRLAARTDTAASLDMTASAADRTRVALDAALAMRAAWEMDRVVAIENQAASLARGVMGPADTERALERAQVSDLIVTERFVHEHPAEARALIRAALAQGADVLEVDGPARARLDAHGGVAAGLRFPTEGFSTEISMST
ncbi:MAG: hypothetical protein IBJ03_02720 [Gemmatimonadaceae bacterium]|nr:hypothetical protein [Gemmatimonadaceae bacterium]